jgi:hypothetical protein
MQVGEDAKQSAEEVALLRHFPDSGDVPAVGCIVASSADSFTLVLPRPVSIERSQCDVIRVTLASSLQAVPWKDLDAVLLSDAACLFCLPWLLKNVLQLTAVVCSSGLLRLAHAMLGDAFLNQHVQFDVAGTLTPMFATHELLDDCVRMLCPAYRLSPMSLLGGGTVTAFCSAADPGCLSWVIARIDIAKHVVVTRRHSIQPALAFGAADEAPPAVSSVPRCCVTLAGVNERAVIDAADAARSALAAGGCVLGISPCPFALARFILLLNVTNVPMFWVGQKSDEVYDCMHRLAEYCTDELLQGAYDRKAPFTLRNALGEILTVAQQDVSCSTECVVVSCCPSVDFVSAWAFSKPTANVVLRFQ